MSWPSAIVLFVVLWTITLFVTLPIGIRQSENPEPGHDPGAPQNPQLGRKLAISAGLAAVLWLIAYAVISSDFLSFSQA